VRSSSGSCLRCGEAEQVHDPVLPFGIESTGHAWLHWRCWSAWYAARRAEAVAALEAMGIARPTSFQTISIKREARNGRLWIGTTGKSR
jgi:hypothetical protein